MKKFALLIVVTMFGLLEFNAGNLYAAPANTNAMIVKFAFAGAIQAPVVTVTNSPNTNSTYKVTKVKIANKDMLSFLSAEFSTTFPDGAQLGLTTDFEFVVLDKSGNVFLNVSSNLTDSSYVFSITNNSSPVITGQVKSTATTTTEIVTEVESDFTVYYADGNGNDFHFGGLVTVKANAVVAAGITTYKTVSLAVSGSGDVDFFNSVDGKYDTGVFTGSWGAAGSGLPQ